jgi:hypothetical protein
VLVAALGALVIADASIAPAAGGSTAVVVIDTGASVRQAVIHFDAPINGITALELAGANPVTYGFAGQGAAVCALDGVGNPADQSCLIGPHGEYWAYFVATGGATNWTYSRGCACTTTVHDGDVEGWRYGTGAAPRSSADFCAYVDCPPPTTSPPAGGGGSPPPATGPTGGAGGGTSGGGTAGGTTAGSGGDQTGGSTAAPTDGQSVADTPQGSGSGSSDPGAPDPVPSQQGSVEPTTSTTPPTTTSRPGNHDGPRVEAAAVHRKIGGGGGSGTTGSPAGVAIAAGALAATAVAATWLRRRRSALR